MSRRAIKPEPRLQEMPFPPEQTPQRAVPYVAGGAAQTRFAGAKASHVQIQSIGMSVLPMKAICSERLQIQASPDEIM